MAVNAQKFDIHLPQQLLNNNHFRMNGDNINMMMYNNNINQHIANCTTTFDSSLLPVYSPARNQASMKDDSGVTYAIPSRKRSRDHSAASTVNQQSRNSNFNNINGAGGYSFLGEDVSVKLLQQQNDVDRYIYQHMEKLIMEINERRRKHSRRIIEAAEEGILKRLKAKEDEIEKIGRINWQLEERVKSLAVENQIWRELALTNEATADALRSNLEQILTQVTNIRAPEVAAACPINDLDDDVESCCGSSSSPVNNQRGEEDKKGWRTVSSSVIKTAESGMCRRCGKAEACVVLLTCKHMCLCAGCGSTRTGMTTACPVCKTGSTAKLVVNLSS